jgi:hypothetical protein
MIYFFFLHLSDMMLDSAHAATVPNSTSKLPSYFVLAEKAFIGWSEYPGILVQHLDGIIEQLGNFNIGELTKILELHAIPLLRSLYKQMKQKFSTSSSRIIKDQGIFFADPYAGAIHYGRHKDMPVVLKKLTNSELSAYRLLANRFAIVSQRLNLTECSYESFAPASLQLAPFFFFTALSPPNSKSSSPDAKHNVPCDPPDAKNSVPCDPPDAKHSVPCDPPDAKHSVPCDPPDAKHSVPCDPPDASCVTRAKGTPSISIQGNQLFRTPIRAVSRGDTVVSLSSSLRHWCCMPRYTAVLDGMPCEYSSEFLDALVSDMLTALSALHDVGLVHGDIKPSNIFVASHFTQNCTRYFLGDFGSVTQYGKIVTTTTRAFIPLNAPKIHKNNDIIASKLLDYVMLAITALEMFKSKEASESQNKTVGAGTFHYSSITKVLDELVLINTTACKKLYNLISQEEVSLRPSNDFKHADLILSTVQEEVICVAD